MIGAKRHALLLMGKAHIFNWCDLNTFPRPEVKIEEGNDPTFGTCAYYRDQVIYIWPEACAQIGMIGRQWSYPGYVVDRTPYGVLAHELGHHVDLAHGRQGGIVSHDWRRLTEEEPITTYCPDDNEWFAEIFRLFVTNPYLLASIRPRVFALLKAKWPKMAENRPWNLVLAGATRQLQAAENKIAQVIKAKPKKQGSLLG